MQQVYKDKVTDLKKILSKNNYQNLFLVRGNKSYSDSGAKEFIENQPENPHINYARNLIAGIHQLEKLMEYLESKLKTIEKATLVVQSRKDPVVNPKGTLKLFDQLGSDIKEYYIFDYDRHGILIGEGVERVYNAIENFIKQWV